MPQAIIGVIGAVGGTAAVSTAVTVAVYSLTAVATLAYSSSQKRKAKRLDQQKYEASVQDHMINLQSTTAPRELVLGRTRKGGAAFFQTSVAPYNAVFVSVLALAGHEIDALEDVYFDETPIQLDGDGNVTTAPWGRYNKITVKETDGHPVRTLAHTPLPGTLSVLRGVPFGSGDYFFPNGVSNVAYTLVGSTLTITDPQPGDEYTVTYQWEQFTSTARVFVHLGSPDQAADARMQALLPGTWTADHRARGVAYLECEFVYDDTSFPSGLPNVTAQIRGAKCYDPRTGLTQFSENPAILQRHVLTHPQFGKRTSITAAEDARFVAAANNCDITISYTGLDSVPMFRAALIVPFGAPASDVLDDLAQAMGGEWAYAAGSLFSRAGVYQAPVMHLTDADLAVVQSSNEGGYSQSPIGLNPHKPRNEKFNTVLPRIWDQAARYIQTPLDPIVADALVAADKASLSQEVPMPAVFYAPQARHIAGILIRDARDPLTVTLPFKMRAYPLELFDSITLTLSRYDWDAKEFRILGRVFSPEGFVTLTLKETTAAIFAYGAPFLPNGYADNTGLPRPWDILPPPIISITSGEDELIVQNDGTVVTAVRVAWAPIQEASIATSGNVEVQWAVLPSGEWRSKVVPGNATEAKFSDGVNDLDVIMVRTRSFNKLASSAWSVQLYHQVIGKTAPPPNIENLSISGSVLSWTLPRRVPDLAGFVFRFQYGINLDWNSAAPLHTGLITESPYDLVTRPGGEVTIMAKAQDTSGNQSLATANIVMNLGDPPIANIVEQWDFKALGWPGVAGDQSGWTLVGGNPSANATDSFYGDDDQRFYRPDTEPFYKDEAYESMVYVTDLTRVSSALAGSLMTLVADTDGVDLRLDYRLAGLGAFYDEDGSSFYPVDTDPFYASAGPWQPWPGQLIAANDVYQFRVTIGAGATRGVLRGLVLTVDAPDLEEQVNDLLVAAGGTLIPHLKPFTVIKNIGATLQTNGSGGVTLEITKTPNLAPVVRVFNAAHTSVGGATVDITLKGY